ncbi:DNA alkylation repair protein [Naasia sp. SYSU D00057]|uniref:DNA alkylation repair protein n=1 Tax=Naasia sp. SYSU D00057 TaxID=2817380 RepID=UPI001B30113C|nr:DNA alkylation repair protein [Naasia sp. SYSU D00057]
MASSAEDVQSALRERARPEDAVFLARFFRAGPGQYGEGDRFLGIRVPETRKVVGKFHDLPLQAVRRLLESPFHEDRLAGLLVLFARFRRASAHRSRDDAERRELHEFYLDAVRSGRVNNWDLVDTSADTLVGQYLLGHPSDLLERLADGKSLWERRVAMIATFTALKAGDASPTLAIAERLLPDREDLIQKAVGWMLREVGKRVSREALTRFLDEAAPRMGRTALSYATEHLDEAERARYRAMPRVAAERMR